jgi:hypothetical protein
MGEYNAWLAIGGHTSLQLWLQIWGSLGRPTEAAIRHRGRVTVPINSG